MFRSMAGFSNARRRNTHRPAGANEALYEPLIPLQHEDEDVPVRNEGQPSTSGQVVPYGYPDVSAWLLNLTIFCTDTWNWLYGALSTCVATWLPAALPTIQLTALQQKRLDELRSRVQVAFDPENEAHQEQLKLLWEAAFPGEPFGGPKCPRWRDMGWQNDSPASDFRGGGLLSLEALNYLAAHHQQDFEMLRHKRTGHRSDWEYPFGAAGVNLAFTLTQTLDLRGVSPLPTAAAGRHFCALLEDSEHAFEEVFAAAYMALDRAWLDTKASYMQFPQVLRQTIEAVERALANKPATVQELRAMLLEA